MQVYEALAHAPLCQTPDLYRKLLESIGSSFVRFSFSIFIFLDKDIAIGGFVFLDDHVCFQRIQHIWYMWTLQGACSTS